MTSHESTSETPPNLPVSTSRVDLWARRVAAGLVAAVAAYGSYEHQRAFAFHGRADPTSAGLWPLSVDGLLVLATVGLLKSSHHTDRRIRLAAWLAFGLGIAVSLAANIASAPALAWQPVLVAGWPPVALLLAVELLAHGPKHREHKETTPETDLVSTRDEIESPREPSAEDVMWEHFQRELSRGRAPTGAELDRIAGTNNFGRAVLRRWRRDGRIPPATVLQLGSRPSTEESNKEEEMTS